MPKYDLFSREIKHLLSQSGILLTSESGSASTALILEDGKWIINAAAWPTSFLLFISYNKNLNIFSVLKLIAKAKFIKFYQITPQHWDIIRVRDKESKKISVFSTKLGNKKTYWNDSEDLDREISAISVFEKNNIPVIQTLRVDKKTTTQPLLKIKKIKKIPDKTLFDLVSYLKTGSETMALGTYLERTESIALSNPQIHKSIHKLKDIISTRHDIKMETVIPFSIAHGDISIGNILIGATTGAYYLIDFERSHYVSSYYDLMYARHVSKAIDDSSLIRFIEEISKTELLKNNDKGNIPVYLYAVFILDNANIALSRNSNISHALKIIDNALSRIERK